MAKKGEKYRLKSIKDQWYEVTKVSGSSVVLKGPDHLNLETIVSLDNLKKNYTQEK